jgi:Ca-activated chloride channel family protein
VNASNWGNIQMLWALAIVPVLVVAYAFDGQRRRRALERIGHLPMIRRMTASISPARRRGKVVLTVAAVALLVTALARPQAQGKGRLTENRGLDLVVALDFSKSMLARDVYPSRLERAKAELGRLIDSLKGDRVGLIAFAGETLSYPLTVDYEAAKLFWRDLGPEDMPVGGTDLGRAIAAAGELLKESRQAELKRRPNAKRHPAQVILLLTDGEDTEGRGVDAARAAAADGVKIFTLGIGSNERPFVQTYDEDGKPNGMLSDGDGRPVRVGLDEQALKQIAQVSGGEYLTVDPQRFGVERVQSAIAGLERTEEEARFEREPDDVGRFLLVPAFLLLVLGAIVRERRANANVNVNVNANASETSTRREPSGRTPTQSRAVAAMILFFLFPFVGGFDLFQRKDPNVEEGNRLLNAGKAEDALKAYDRAVTALPEDPVAHFDRGAALYQLGKYPEAQKEFLHAAEGRDPQVKADAYYNMGNAWFQQQRYKEALEAYKHTLGLRPEDRRAKWNLELALKKMQEQKQQQQQQQQNDKNQQQKDEKQQQQQQQAQNDKNQQQKDEKQQQQQQQQDQQQQQQQQQAQGDEKQKQQQQQQQQQQSESQEREKEKQRQALAQKEKPREIDKQDAEAVLDALERVEPTVQKDLARRRAGNRRPSKDW